MAQYKTLQFENNAEGQSEKIKAINEHARAGWRVVSESITPGKFKGEQACCLFLIFAPCAFLAGSTDGTINVTLEHPSDAQAEAPRVAAPRAEPLRPIRVAEPVISLATQTSNRRWSLGVLAGLGILLVVLYEAGSANSTPPAPAAMVVAPVPPLDTVSYRIARFWKIPNGGYGRVVVISHHAVTDSALRVLGAQLVAYTRFDRNAFIDVFDSDKAAAMSAHVPEGNDETGRFYDRHFVAQYTKNANSGINEWEFMLKGLNGPVVHVKY